MDTSTKHKSPRKSRGNIGATQHSTINEACYFIGLREASSLRLPIEISLKGDFGREVRLGLRSGAAPGLAPTIVYYRIEDSLSVELNGTEIEHCLNLANEFGRNDELVIHLPRDGRDVDEIVVKYVLDTSRNEQLRNNEIGQVYKDRVILKSHFAAMRGDVLFFPLDGSEPHAKSSGTEREAICNQDHGETRQADGGEDNGPNLNYQFQISVPDEWVLHVNAETQERDNIVRWEHEDYSGYAHRWFSIAGRNDALITCDIDAIGDSVGRRLVAVKSEEELDTQKPSKSSRTKNGPDSIAFPASDAVDVAKQFIDDFDQTFGLEMLNHVRIPYHEGGAGTSNVYLFLVPFPNEMRFGAGGQYARGTTYVFYTIHRPGPLAHTGAHEYFHVYNDSALSGTQFMNNWFAEGYTEVQGTLSWLRLQTRDSVTCENLYKLEMARNFASMQHEPILIEVEKQLRSEGLVVPVQRMPPPDPPIGTTPFDRFPPGGQNRLIRGRSFLVMHIIAMIFESGVPYRRGFDGWFKSLYRDFGVYENGYQNELNYRGIRSAAIENAGSAMFELDTFLNRFVENNEVIEFEELVYWMRWAEQRDLFSTLFAPRDD